MTGGGCCVSTTNLRFCLTLQRQLCSSKTRQGRYTLYQGHSCAQHTPFGGGGGGGRVVISSSSVLDSCVEPGEDEDVDVRSGGGGGGGGGTMTSCSCSSAFAFSSCVENPPIPPPHPISSIPPPHPISSISSSSTTEAISGLPSPPLIPGGGPGGSGGGGGGAAAGPLLVLPALLLPLTSALEDGLVVGFQVRE
jgi:hypothetical protein